jgi:DHA2 family multidrug resistance protein
MVNFMRNIGSSVGTSIVTTLLARRAQFHQEVLIGHIRADNPRLQKAVGNLSQHLVQSGLDKHGAQVAAYSRIYQSIQAQSGAAAYVDTFMVLAVGSGIMFFLSFILKKNDPGGGGRVVAE